MMLLEKSNVAFPNTFLLWIYASRNLGSIYNCHNKHMAIINPRYIIEAKKEAAKKINSRKIRQNTIKSENVINEIKGTFKSDISLTKTTSTDCLRYEAIWCLYKYKL